MENIRSLYCIALKQSSILWDSDNQSQISLKGSLDTLYVYFLSGKEIMKEIRAKWCPSICPGALT